MGIKDNFQQALRELTGTDKDETKREKQIDVMKSAVAAGDTGEFDAIKDTTDSSSYEEIERRAAAAADEYSRQQSAYTGTSYMKGESFDDLSSSSEYGSVGGKSEQAFDPGQSAQSMGSYQQSRQDSYQQPNMGGYQQPRQDSYQQPNMGGYQQPRQDSYQQSNMGGYQQSRQDSYQQQKQSSYQQQSNIGGKDDTYYRSGESGYSSGTGYVNDPASEQSRIFSAARYRQNVTEDDEITVISKNTVIDGNVRSFANMSVAGNIKGNIETTKDIDLNGKIVGNIACNNAQMRTSQIQGNIQMKGNAYMERDTLLIGDLTSTYANINGKIKGNLDITGKAELKSDAVVFGDISASTITVNDGAIIQGYVSTTFLNKEESKNIFPDTITIGD